MKAAKRGISGFIAAERVKTPWWFGGTMSPDGDVPSEGGDTLAKTIEQVGKLRPAQDRRRMLITDDGPTEWFIGSARRWIAAMMADEGILGPLEGGNRKTKAEVRTRQKGTLAGLYVTDILLREWMPDARFTWTMGEGSRINAGDCILTIEGGRHQLLICERIILNILGRLSGIATNTARWVANSQIPLAATRKTGWGVLDKAAVAVGGGLTHRIHRADALMLKENDLASAAEDGEVGPARVRTVLRDVPKDSIGAFVTVEVRTLDEALAAAEAWAERMLEFDEGMRLNIMLDNMGPELARDAVLDIETRGLREYVTIEASGNIVFDELEAWQGSKVDVISTSGLHRAAPPLDLTCIFEGV
jgi:nicotinate-nucleotide pyrophosphorylase (carboxylating)